MLPPGGAPNGAGNGFPPPSAPLAPSASTPADFRRGPPLPDSLVRLGKINEDTWLAIGKIISFSFPLPNRLVAHVTFVKLGPYSVHGIHLPVVDVICAFDYHNLSLYNNQGTLLSAWAISMHH